MLIVPTAMHGYTLEASDGPIGTVKDFLFDDRSWQCRWLVVDTGGWLTGRKVLIHPSAIGMIDHNDRVMPVDLTKAQVKDSPDILDHEPVSQQIETSQYDYYGWDPYWGNGLYGATMATQFAGPQRFFGGPDLTRPLEITRRQTNANPNLRSMAEITGYHVHAKDGDIGHVENMLIDDDGFGVRYLIIATSNWWFGEHVLMSPFAIREIEYVDRKVYLGVTREKVRNSPPWDPVKLIDQDMEARLHGYYQWPGYGWRSREGTLLGSNQPSKDHAVAGE